jgi:subtilase family protein
VLDPLVRVVQYASTMGMTVVVAVGNNASGSENRYAGITSPANAPSALSVGAVSMGNPRPTVTRGDDFVADFSARGPTFFDGFAKPDLVAPGVQLISDTVTGSSKDLLYNNPVLAGGRVDVRGNAFLRLSGTSMSAAVASGVAALVLEAAQSGADQPLPPNAVKAILEYTAVPVTVNKPDVLTQGAGEINAGGAVALASRIDTSTRLGGWWVTSGIQPSTTIGGTSYRWAQNIVWGNDALGGDIVFHQLLIWSPSVLWGTNIVWGNTRNILWGTGTATTVPFGAKGAVLAGGLKIVAPAGGNSAGNNIVWGNQIIDGVVTMFVAGVSQADAFSVLWGSATGPIVRVTNIVWGNGTVWGRNLVAGRITGLRDASNPLNVFWGDNIVWGNNRLSGQNIVWGFQQLAAAGRNILWGTWDGTRVIYGNSAALGETVIHGTLSFPADAAVWSIVGGDNIVWGNVSGDQVVWGSGYHAPY